jgi:hypothetical protein
MEKEYVLKLHLHEVSLIVDALESEKENISKIIPTDGKELDALNSVKNDIDTILYKIENKMVCVN